MLSKEITYEDLEGNPVTETFYFHLSKAEIAELELEHEGGLHDYLQAIVSASNTKAILVVFKEIISRCVGRRSVDGKRFLKDETHTQEFMSSEAYSELFVEFLTKPELFVAFINGIIPKGLRDKISETPAPVVEIETSPKPLKAIPSWMAEGREPTRQELEDTPQEMLMAHLRGMSAVSNK